MKILLVEDSATLRHAMSSYITDAGHTPLIAKSGEEALQLIENTPVDMVIMDVEMPGLNGFETTRLIREWLGDHWIPIIFVTGKNEDESYHEGIEAGGDDYLIKPVSQVILRAKIRAMERITEMRNQLRSLNKELEQLSQYDSLTELYNRRTFTEQATQQWLQMARHRHPLSLLMLDVDHFKLYNDSYGHPAGDACLKQVASAIKDTLHRPVDLTGRYGGEEFIVLLPETDLQGAELVGESIRQAVETLNLEHRASPSGRVVSMSIGGASVIPTPGTSLESLIKQADTALYKAKDKGRNRVHLDSTDSHKTLLVVDNDSESLKFLHNALKDRCHIVTADNGEESLDIAEAVNPDLILVDLQMPSINAIDLCQTLKLQPHTAAIPVLAISSENIEKIKKGSERAGADDYLQKPLCEQQLLTKITRFLQ